MRDTGMNLEIGTKYLIKEELKSLCCNYVFKPGQTVKIFSIPSKNRVIVSKNNSLHKVKRSSLNRTSEEI